MLKYVPTESSRKEQSKNTYFIFYSLKNGRNIQLYSQQCYYQALILEMDADVISYCERPNLCDGLPQKNVFDFIVEYQNSDKLVILRMHSVGTTFPAQMKNEESDFCDSRGYRYEFITLDHETRDSYYLQNIKYLYCLLKRVKSPRYSKYVDLLVHSISKEQRITIADFMNEYHMSAYEALVTTAFAIYRGVIHLRLNSEAITLNMEVYP